MTKAYTEFVKPLNLFGDLWKLLYAGTEFAISLEHWLTKLKKAFVGTGDCGFWLIIEI
jgi:hypothetical protein